MWGFRAVYWLVPAPVAGTIWLNRWYRHHSSGLPVAFTMIYSLHGRHRFLICSERSAQLTSCLPHHPHVWTYQRALCPYHNNLTGVSSSFIFSPLCRCHCILIIVSSVCVLAIVSSPCILTIISSPLYPHHCILTVVSSALCPYLCFLTIISLPLCSDPSAYQAYHYYSYFLIVTLFHGLLPIFLVTNSVILISIREATPTMQSHSHPSIHPQYKNCDVSILSTKTTILINNGYHQAAPIGSAPLTTSKPDSLLQRSADQLSQSCASMGFVPLRIRPLRSFRTWKWCSCHGW